MDNHVIGSYKILKKMGAGGMAKVYLAVHQDVPNLKVVLKVLSDSRLVERFKQEADKLALLDGNSSICRIKHFFQQGEDIVIAMEYIDGVTLDEIIRRDGPISGSEALRIINDVLKVLQFAHDKGIYHRDIKPSNIMVDQNGNVKVIDFGIAKAKSDPNLTVAGTACGTPAYMAPEQFTPSDDTNYALVDIYAVGTTLYYLLSGQLPFKGDNEFAIRDAKLFSDPPRLKEVAAGISRDLDEAVMRALKKDPSQRQATALELLKALEAIRHEEITHSPTIDVKTEKHPKVKSPKKKSQGKLIAAVAIVVVLAVGGYWVFSPPTPPEPDTPQLLSPLDGAVLEVGPPELTWKATVEQGGSYILEYANNPDFYVSAQVRDLTETTYTLTEQLENGDYYWRVQAVEADNTPGGSSPVHSFTLNLPPVAGSTGQLKVTVTPRGDIYVDNRLVEENSTGADLTLDTGRHSVIIRNDRAVNREFSGDVQVVSDTTVTVAYAFRFPPPESTTPADSPPEPAETEGEVRVGSKPTIGADIYIDGRLQNRKSPSAFRLEPGTHIIRAVLIVDGEPRERVDTVAVEAASSTKIIFDFES
ncbi:MAG: serine/threonine protein kinase [candidate division Zixibacteria bacterium]|nr:serine/threonine protein kinase [candidate division Zixibacteria bacterium]